MHMRCTPPLLGLVPWLLSLGLALPAPGQQPVGTLNVRTDGTAIGDGMADDTAALNAAMSSAQAQDKDVYFPAGEYRITSGVTVRDGVSCYGDASGVSVIRAASKIEFGEPNYGVAVRNVNIEDLFFHNAKLNLYGPSKRYNHVRRCVFASSDPDHAGDSQVNYRGKDSSFDACVFLMQTDSWNDKGLSTYRAERLTVQHCIFGLDMANLGWLATEWSGYTNWNNAIPRLQAFQTSQGLDDRLGAFRGAIRFNDDIGVFVYSNILNFDPVFCGTDQSPPDSERPDIDHVIYATQVADLEIVSNWIRGHPQSPAGGLKHRNTLGPGVIAANYFDDTPLLTYAYDNSEPFAFENQLIYRNHFKIRTPESAFPRNGISYYPSNTSMSESNITVAANTYDCTNGFSSISISRGTPSAFDIYDSNLYLSGTPVEIVGTYGPYTHTPGAPPPALTDPYDGYTVPFLDIPIYGEPPPVPTHGQIRVTLAPEADSFVSQEFPEANNGASTYLTVRNERYGTGHRPYLRFSVPATNLPIAEVNLKLYCWRGTHTLVLHEVADHAWTEAGITWSNAPPLGSLLVSRPVGTDVWETFDLSEYVTGPGTYSVGVNSDSGSYRRLDAREGAHPPELEMVYWNPSADSDGDGMPDWWEDCYFDDPTNGVAGVDGDGDGPDNLAECVAGTHPTNGASYFAASITHAPAGVVVSWYAVTGRTYSVRYRSEPGAGESSELAGGLILPQMTYTDTTHGVEGSGFYQVGVQRTP